MPIRHDTYAVPRADLGIAFHEYDPTLLGFVATKILPILAVMKKSATLSVIVRENLKRVDTKRANGAAFNRIGLTAEDLAYACQGHGLEAQLTDVDRENYADDYDAEIETTQILKKKFYNELEIETATAVFNTTTWTGAALYTDNKATPWSTTATDIFAQITAAKEKVRANTGVKPDALIIGEAAMNNLLINDDVRGRFPGAMVITEEMLRANMASLFGLKELIVGGAVYDSAKEGQDFTAADIWDYKYAMVAKIQRGPTKVEPGLGRTVIWTGVSSPDEEQPVLQYREPQTKSDIFQIEQFSEEKIFDKYFAHLMRIET
jgi:hypothetical protein